MDYPTSQCVFSLPDDWRTDNPQSRTFTASSCQNHTMSPSLVVHNQRSQYQGIANSVSRLGVTTGIQNTSVPEVIGYGDSPRSHFKNIIWSQDDNSVTLNSDLHSDHAAYDDTVMTNSATTKTNNQKGYTISNNRDNKRKRSHPPNIVGHRRKRPRVQCAVSPHFHIPAFVCDTRRSKEMYSCISHLLLMAAKGEETISSRYVQCIIQTLASTIEPAMSSNLQQTYRSTLCSFHKEVFDKEESNRMASVRSLRLLQSAETFKIRQPVHKEWSNWDSELLFNMFLRLPSQGRDLEECHEVANGEVTDDSEVKMIQRKPLSQVTPALAGAPRSRKATFFSMGSKDGRVDIRTSCVSTFGASMSDHTAEVILTPPTSEVESAQIRFLLSQRTTPESIMLATPILSVQRMIPDDSKIFQIAATGTVQELREMFEAGMASLTDCGANGRSLIGVSLLSGEA